jgi:hypothetical protein
MKANLYATLILMALLAVAAILMAGLVQHALQGLNVLKVG